VVAATSTADARGAIALDLIAVKQQDARVMSSTSNWGSIVSLALALAFLSTLGACSGESTPGGEASGGSGGSGGGGGSGATGLPNPCTLVTNAELGPIVDKTLTRSEEERSLSGGDPGCTWYDAENYPVFQLALWDDTAPYESTKEDDRSVPLSGIGAEAFLAYGNTVHVMTKKGGTFFAQALYPAADGKVSSEIQSAVSSDMMPKVLEYEAAFRLAKLVVNDL
jgi:hypothetical protein